MTKDLANADMIVWPNPVKGYLQISFTHEEGSIEITSMDGRMLFNQKLHQRQQLNLLELPDSFYIYQLKMGNAILEIGKLTKQTR